MVNAMLRTIAVSFAVVVVAMGGSASATIVESPESSATDNYNTLISTSDLINAGQASLASASIAGGTLLGGSLAGTHDGIGQDGATLNNAAFLWDTITLQYDLNTGAGGSARGYDISQVDVVVGWWLGEQYANQGWSIAVATLANPTFTTLKSVSYAPFGTPAPGQEGFGYTHVRLTDDTGVVATGVTAIRVVNYIPGVLSEIDVVGAATIPEPATGILLATGITALLAYARRRRTTG